MSIIENSKSLHYLSASASASASALGIKTSFVLSSPSEASSKAHQKMYCPWKSIDLQRATSFTPRVLFNNCSICYFSSLFGDKDGVALLESELFYDISPFKFSEIFCFEKIFLFQNFSLTTSFMGTWYGMYLCVQ